MTRPALDALAVVDLDDPEPTVAAPYSARPVIKALYWPLRRWDPQRGVWVVKAAGIRTLIAGLRDAGYDVDVWIGGQMRTLNATSGKRRP